ncbi:MAG TPA: hypothetical protein VFW33_01395 [Gemmataceae bacterium]|nr:hypothetical protein [Gemmataceae bacterium]
MAEAYAEGAAALDDLSDAHDGLDAFRCSDTAEGLPAANSAALEAAFWLCPDDYKVIRAVDHISDAAGYLRAVAAGALTADAPPQRGESGMEAPGVPNGQSRRGTGSVPPHP